MSFDWWVKSVLIRRERRTQLTKISKGKLEREKKDEREWWHYLHHCIHPSLRPFLYCLPNSMSSQSSLTHACTRLKSQLLKKRVAIKMWDSALLGGLPLCLPGARVVLGCAREGCQGLRSSCMVSWVNLMWVGLPCRLATALCVAVQHSFYSDFFNLVNR